MSDFLIEKVDAGTWDLVLEENSEGFLDFVVVGDTEETWPQEVAQRVTYKLGAWAGESMYDRSVGFPYRQGVFGKQPIEGIESLLYSHIEEVDGVEGFLTPPTLELDARKRQLRVFGEVQGEGFTIPIDQIVGAPLGAPQP